jgi:predicted Rossmann fold nucleotide-binding protein DprA/Smf involved in DNA uptake
VGSKGAEGTNGLLRDGANLLLDTRDILRKYDYIFAESINYEAFEKSKENSRADRRWLDRLGVISLQRSSVEDAAKSKKPLQEASKPNVKDERSASAVQSSKQGDGANASRTASQQSRIAVTDEPKKAKQETKEQPKEQPKEEIKTASAQSGAIPKLSPVQYAVLEAIPDDGAVTVDKLSAIGHPYGEIIAALTMLEIMGLVKKLPGALYIRA